MSLSLAVAKVFLLQVSHYFPSLKLVNWLESRLILRLNDSTGVNWWEEAFDDPANPGGGLEVMSPVSARILVLEESQMKSSQSSIVMLL